MLALLVPLPPPEAAVATQTETVTQSVERIYQINGGNTTIRESELDRLGDYNALPDFKSQNLVFTSDTELRNWANNQPLDVKTTIINKLDSIAMLQQMAARLGLLDDEQATQAYIEKLYGLPTSEAIVSPNNGSGKKGQPSTQFVVGNGVLFEGYSTIGTSLIMSLPIMPTFWWMTNRTSSYFLTGGKAFCDRTWYRGTRWWRFGPPFYIMPTNLVNTGEDNRYESCL